MDDTLRRSKTCSLEATTTRMDGTAGRVSSRTACICFLFFLLLEQARKEET